jgi:hypothetical protein
MPADRLADEWRHVAMAAGIPDPSVVATTDPGAALQAALENGTGPIIVAGSLYLVGAVRGRLVDDPALRDPID